MNTLAVTDLTAGAHNTHTVSISETGLARCLDCAVDLTNPFLALARPELDVPTDDHRTAIQKRLDQARTNAKGFPRGLRTF